MLYLIIHTAYGTIQNLISSLSGTEHAFACNDELLTFTCSVTGSLLIWNINTSPPIRIEYFSRRDAVGNSTTISKAVGLLLQNDPISSESSNLTSALFVNYTESTFNLTATYRITCESDTDSDFLHTSISG